MISRRRAGPRRRAPTRTCRLRTPGSASRETRTRPVATGRFARRCAPRASRPGLVRRFGRPRPRHDVRVGVALGEEPVLARAAEPPLALHTPFVRAEVDVLVELAHGRHLLRP